MSENTPPDEPTDPPPAPPPPPFGDAASDDPQTSSLRRSRSNRVLAGVGGGLGHYFGIDPVIIRIAFVILTISGGSGLLIYLICWLVIAKEGEDETRTMQMLRGSPQGNRPVVFLVLGVGAILVLSSPLFWWDGLGVGNGLALPLLLVAAGVAFLLWPDAPDRLRRSVGPNTGETPDSTPPSSQAWKHGYQQRTVDTPPKPPKPQPFLGPLTMSALLMFAGTVLLGEQLDWFDAHPALYAGIALLIVGLGLVLSAFYGRARGLIVVGALLLPIAWALNAVDIDWHGGIGEEQITVDSLAELDSTYNWGIGEYVVDLSRLDLDGDDHAVDISLTIGEVIVFVHEDLAADIDIRAALGEVKVDEVDQHLTDEGPNARIGTQLGSPADDGTLDLNITVGLGAATVRTCTSAATPGLVSCP